MADEKPKTIENPDFAHLKALCEEYVGFVYGQKYYEDNDYAQYIFEAAMQAFYGKHIWTIINEKLK